MLTGNWLPVPQPILMAVGAVSGHPDVSRDLPGSLHPQQSEASASWPGGRGTLQLPHLQAGHSRRSARFKEVKYEVLIPGKEKNSCEFP